MKYSTVYVGMDVHSFPAGPGRPLPCSPAGCIMEAIPALTGDLPMTENEFNLLYAVKKHGLLSFRKLSVLAGVSTGYISRALKDFETRGWTCHEGITETGLNALKPFRFALLTIGKQYNNIIKSPAPIFGMAFFTSAIATLQTLVVALGAGLGVWGAINLLEGYGNDNPGAKSQGMKHVIPN